MNCFIGLVGRQHKSERAYLEDTRRPEKSRWNAAFVVLGPNLSLHRMAGTNEMHTFRVYISTQESCG